MLKLTSCKPGELVLACPEILRLVMTQQSLGPRLTTLATSRRMRAQLWVSGETMLGTMKQRARHRVARSTCACHSAVVVVENIQHVPAVSFTAPAPCGVHRASASCVLRSHSFVLRSASCALRLAITCSVRRASTRCGSHRASASHVAHLSPVEAMHAARESVVENIPSVGVLHTLSTYEGCVNAILRWTRLAVFLQRCHVQSHAESASSLAPM